MIQVTKNVYVEPGIAACNLGLISTKEGVVLIDTPMQPTVALQWRSEASKKGEIRYLINSEEHVDHWQTCHFYPGLLISHSETRRCLAEESVESVKQRVKNIDPAGMNLMGDYKIRLADMTFDDGMEIHLGDHTFRLFPLPGHSVGGMGIYIPQEGVVFTADVLFHKVKSWLHESNPEKWIASLRRLEKLDVESFVPGHGAPCKKEYLKEQAGIVEQWVEAVKRAIKQGLPLEEAQTKISCPDPYPKEPGKVFITDAELNRQIIARLYRLYSV